MMIMGSLLFVICSKSKEWGGEYEGERKQTVDCRLWTPFGNKYIIVNPK